MYLCVWRVETEFIQFKAVVLSWFILRTHICCGSLRDDPKHTKCFFTNDTVINNAFMYFNKHGEH